MGHNGYQMLKDIPCDFSRNFDLVITKSKLHFLSESDGPTTIYTKTDFLPDVESYLCSSRISKPFILTTGCSDYSPQVNFLDCYTRILNNPLLVTWYMENKVYQHSKVKSLPVGLASHSNEVENDILYIREKRVEKKDGVFCCWKSRTYNDIGQDYCIRPEYEKKAKTLDKFFWYDPKFERLDFFDTMSSFKYVLCPHGNGVDPAPTSWSALSLGCIPVIHRTENSIDIYDEIQDNVIFVDSVDDLSYNYLESQNKQPLSDINFLTANYWAKKILD